MIKATRKSQPTTVANKDRIYASAKSGQSLDHKELVRSLEALERTGALTTRDERLLEYIRELNVLSLNQARRLLWPTQAQKTVYNRLHRLVTRHLLNRIRAPRAGMRAWGLDGEGLAGLVYSLGPGGRLWLKDRVSKAYLALHLRRNQILHDLLVAELGVGLTEAVFGRGPQWELTLAGERAASYFETAKDKVPTARPDALAIIRQWQPDNRAATLPFFVELDASREAHGRPSSDWGRKAHGYDLFHAGPWPDHPLLADLAAFPRVAVITHGPQRLLNLVEAILEHRREPVTYTLALWPDLRAGADLLLTPAWLMITPEGEVLGRERAERQPLLPVAPPAS